MAEKIERCVCCGQPITAEQLTFQSLKGIREVVINTCHGGFGLSYKASLEYLARTGTEYTLIERESRDDTARFGHIISTKTRLFWDSRDIARDDPTLVQLVKDWGKDANSEFAELKIVRIPGNVEWNIQDYDGREWVAERHRTWS